jgi:phage tail protein X
MNTTYTTKHGQRWDEIALAAYGDATMIQPIIEANPAVALTPELPQGIVLLIPILEPAETEVNNLPPWKR